MTQIDKQELRNLKTTLLNLESTQSTVITQILSDIDLSLCFESIMLYRNLNELFLYLNTYKTIDKENFIGFKDKLISQIDSVIGER